jgi:hypothetical protein
MMMRRPAAVVVLLGVCVSAIGTPLAGGQAVTIRVSPVMVRQPASIRITATVEPDERNRTLAISAESAGYTTAHQMQLEGINAARVWETEFRDIPQGNYDVTATVIGTGGRRATASRVVVVMR